MKHNSGCIKICSKKGFGDNDLFRTEFILTKKLELLSISKEVLPLSKLPLKYSWKHSASCSYSYWKKVDVTDCEAFFKYEDNAKEHKPTYSQISFPSFKVHICKI